MQNNDLLRYQTLITKLNDAILVEDKNRSISLVNQAFCDLFNIPAPPEALIGSDCSDAAEQSKHLFTDPEGFVQGVQTVLENRQPVFNTYLELTNGTKLERDYIPAFDQDSYLGHMWVYKDLTHHYQLEHELTKSQDRLETLTITDALTGIGNRRYLEESIQHHSALCQRNHQSLSLCLIDLDNFKRINDVHGHDYGDLVLKEFANFLQTQIRQADILARYGGEEFVILMPETDSEQAEQFVKRILHNLNNTKIAGFEITFSAGVTELELGQNHNQLITTADKAMYQVKSDGKNNVHTLN